MSAAVHPNALYTANTNELNAYIITAIALLRKVYQLLRSLRQRRAMAILPISSAFTELCRPSEHNSKASPTKIWFSLVSTLRNMLLPSERLRTCETTERLASPEVTAPIRSCSLLKV